MKFCWSALCLLPYTYKFSWDVYLANAPFLTNFAILILQSPENFVNGSFVWKISPPRVAQASLYAFVRSIGALRSISDHLRMSWFNLSNCIHVYKVYKDVWSTSAGPVLQCERENRTANILTRWQSRNSA